jgi:FtsH-binding integral membrane protein
MSQYFSTTRPSVDVQKRFLYQVYAWMGAAILLTAFAAFFTAQSPALQSIIFGGARGFPIGMLVLIVAEIGLVWYLSARVFDLQFETGAALFALYAVLNGVTLSVIFLAYTTSSIASTFFVCAAMFFAMSLYGWTTKSDLSKWGNILFMALIGMVIASLVNFFLHSDALGYIISFVGVIVFTGLTAYDTFKLKEAHNQLADNPVMAKKLGILGALTLYLDFVNLFLMLLRLFGGRRD